MASRGIKRDNQVFQIAYEIVNPTQKETIVFLHGWGSNKEIMKQAFGNLFSAYKHIYIDMPGFGKSSNEYILTTNDYADIMQLFLNEIHLEPTIIFGHSFGGKVATLLHPKNLILLSSAGILETKSKKTLLTIRMAKIFNKLGLGGVTKALRSKDVNMMSEIMYATFKNVVDEDFSDTFKKNMGNTIIFWGEKDSATTIESGKTIHHLIKNSFFKSYDGDHYFFLSYAKDIEKNIMEYKV